MPKKKHSIDLQKCDSGWQWDDCFRSGLNELGCGDTTPCRMTGRDMVNSLRSSYTELYPQIGSGVWAFGRAMKVSSIGMKEFGSGGAWCWRSNRMDAVWLNRGEYVWPIFSTSIYSTNLYQMLFYNDMIQVCIDFQWSRVFITNTHPDDLFSKNNRLDKFSQHPFGGLQMFQDPRSHRVTWLPSKTNTC